MQIDLLLRIEVTETADMGHPTGQAVNLASTDMGYKQKEATENQEHTFHHYCHLVPNPTIDLGYTFLRCKGKEKASSYQRKNLKTQLLDFFFGRTMQIRYICGEETFNYDI
ncbi:MAG: hypothetical protein IKA75_04615 [Bacteroidaceae bacterium]|nr:hypothetical protein [Bacteroidaceae bacterium]